MIDKNKGYTEVLNSDCTKRIIQDRMELQIGDVFRGHDAKGGEGVGPWMIATGDPVRAGKGVRIKADFYRGKIS